MNSSTVPAVHSPSHTTETTMPSRPVSGKLDQIFKQYVRNNPLPSAVLSIQSSDGAFAWSASHGPKSAADVSPLGLDDPYFLASATKLFVTAMIMQVRSQGLLSLDNAIVDLLPAGAIDGIHVGKRNGHVVDHTKELTFRHLLSHTSGLSNYLEDRQRDRTVLLREAMKPGMDQGWTRHDILELHRTQFEPRFAPTRNRAHYSDTNFQLLGMVLEAVTKQTFAQNLQARIIEPLGLKSTGVFGSPTSCKYVNLPSIYAGAKPLQLPLVMASVQEDGGMYSSIADSMRFLRAFFNGTLFPAIWLAEIEAERNRIFFPFQYGLGLMRFTLPRFLAPFGSPVFLGHGGASGCLMFYEPSKRLFVAGTLNQIEQRSGPYSLMMRLIQAVS
jgi:D-alanyl-D-alanine carboxypeptidase